MDAAGEKAARRRVDRVFDRFSELSNEDLRRVALPPRSVPRGLDGRVRRAAHTAGLANVLEDARREAVELVLERFGDATYDPTFLGLNWGRSLGPVEDRTAIATALGDAAMAAVVDGLVGEDLLARLRTGFETLEAAALDEPPSGSAAAALEGTSPPVRLIAVALVAFMLIGTLVVPFLLIAAEAAGIAGIAVGVLVVSAAAVVLRRWTSAPGR